MDGQGSHGKTGYLPLQLYLVNTYFNIILLQKEMPQHCFIHYTMSRHFINTPVLLSYFRALEKLMNY